MKKILIIAVVILSLLAIPITAGEVTAVSVVNDFINSVRRMTEDEFILLQERVTPQVVQNAVSFVAHWQSLVIANAEANNIIIERKDKARAGIVQR
ncbi:MAG: hypothetical protein E3J83_03425 [Candidatus Atribacteria bacterium]|nr:MAG: hypothetical protein E3J83_03425 [Candidatus Atribacteria bacterium]